MMTQNMAWWHRLIYLAGGGGLAVWAVMQAPVAVLLAAIGIVGVLEGVLGV